MVLSLLGGHSIAALAQPSASAARPRPEFRPPAPGAATAKPGAEPKEAAAEKQLERVRRQAAERRATRDARGRDERKELARTMRRWLRSGPMTDEVRAELATHAKRVARLLRIQELAAADGDSNAVKRADRLLNREESRHSRWLRELGRPSAAVSASPASPARTP